MKVLIEVCWNSWDSLCKSIQYDKKMQPNLHKEMKRLKLKERKIIQVDKKSVQLACAQGILMMRHQTRMTTEM